MHSETWSALPLPDFLGIGCLGSLAGGKEMVEQAFAVGERPPQGSKLGGLHRQQRHRELHDVLEGQQEVDGPSTAPAPARDRTASHGIEMMPSTARHSAGRIN